MKQNPKRDWTTISISKKHDAMLEKIIKTTKRDKKNQVEFYIEEGARNVQ